MSKAGERIINSLTQAIAIAKGENPQRYTPEEVLGEITPGRILRGARHREGLTQKEMAAKLNISETYLSMLENGRRPITQEIAKRIEATTGTSYKNFL